MNHPFIRSAALAGMRTAVAVLCLAAASSAALAQDVHAIEPTWDSVQGTTGAGAGPHVLPIRLVEGAPLSLEVKADKGSTFHPTLAVLGLDRQVDADATALVVTDPKGTKVSLKGYIPKGTGLHYVLIGAADGSTGAWTFKSKVALPKGAAGAGDLGAEGVEFSFVGPGAAVASISVKGAPSASGAPVFDEIRDPAGLLVPPGEIKIAKTGFSLKGVELGKQGRHTLSFLPGPGGPGTYKVSIKWKVAKGTKRTLPLAGVIADPVINGISPDEGDIDEILPMHVMVDFAQPGASVKFRYGTLVMTVLPGAITHVPGELQFNLNLANLGLEGNYDVEVLNPDGGTDSLAQALTVNMVSPELVSISPVQVYDGAVRRIRVNGTSFYPNAAIRLRMGASSLPGTVVAAGPGYRDADFNLVGAAIGNWDVGALNQGAPEVFLNGALSVLGTVTVSSMTPADNTAGTLVDAVITGTGFLDGATATLSRDGGALTIPGADLLVASANEIQTTFDTAGQAAAVWDLVVTVPGGAVVTLEGCFETKPQKLPPSDPVNPISASSPADGPPSIAHDPKSGEYCLAWAEEDTAGGSGWHIYAIRLDSAGEPQGKPVGVSDDKGSAQKRYAVVGFDPSNGEYLVVWTEQVNLTPTQTGIQHPSGKGAVDLWQVMAQRLASSDLSKTGSNIRVTDGTTYSGGQKGVNWVISDFNSYCPAIAFDDESQQWAIAWMEEFDTTGLYNTNNYDVFQRYLDPSSSTLGSLNRVASTTEHEGDPAMAYDAKNSRMLLAYVRGDVENGRNRDLYLGSNAILPGKGDDFGDPRIAVDAVSGTAVLTWTRVVSDGTLQAEAASVDLTDLSTLLGSPLVLGSGATDMLVRPVANQAFEEIHLFWTRKDGKGNLSAMRRSAETSTDAGLVATADEVELSSGSGDEALPAAVYAETLGDTAVVWFQQITETGNTTYTGDILPKGTMRGIDFWFQLFR